MATLPSGTTLQPSDLIVLDAVRRVLRNAYVHPTDRIRGFLTAHQIFERLDDPPRSNLISQYPRPQYTPVSAVAHALRVLAERFGEVEVEWLDAEGITVTLQQGAQPVEPGNAGIQLYRLKDSGIDPSRFEREVAEMAADPDVQRELGGAGRPRPQS